MELNTIAQRIKFIRKEKNMTMESFGKKIGVSKQSVSMIENGERNPAETTIRTICSKFGVDYFWLTQGTGDVYVDNLDFLIEEISAEKGYDEQTTEILKGLFSLSEEDFKRIIDMIHRLAQSNEGK